MIRLFGHPLFAPVLALSALAWGTLLIVFLILGPALGGWATTVLTVCFGWNAGTRAYRIDAVLFAALQPPLFALVVAIFYADELRAFVRRRGGRVVSAAALGGFAVAAAGLVSSGPVVGGVSPSGPPAVREMRPAPRAVLADHRGGRFELGGARGRPMALTFIYAGCHSTCPALVARLKAVEARLGGRAEFVAVTLDPGRDTPATLAAYAERWDLGLAFHLLSGPPADVAAAGAAWGVRARRLPDGELAHENVIFLLDARGRVAYTLPGLGGGVDEISELLEGLSREG